MHTVSGIKGRSYFCANQFPFPFAFPLFFIYLFFFSIFFFLHFELFTALLSEPIFIKVANEFHWNSFQEVIRFQ